MTQTAREAVDSLAEAARLLAPARRVAVMAHVNPDADALGAVLGLALGLRAMGKEVTAALSDPVPRYAQFLTGSETVVSTLPPGAYDVFILADAASIDRVGALYEADPGRFDSAPILNIDHHRTNPLFGAVNYVDPRASSTSELAFHLLEALGAPLDAGTVTALLFGIVGDTGSFRNAATTPGSLEVASRLVALGGNIELISFHLFEWKTFSAARLWGKVLSEIELDRQRAIVIACLSQAMLNEEGGNVEETEGIAEYLRGIEEAECVMLLKETPDGDIRVSMRSRPAVDVAAIASSLGGGGHRQAAGCTLPGPFATARAMLIEAYDRELAGQGYIPS